MKFKKILFLHLLVFFAAAKLLSILINQSDFLAYLPERQKLIQAHIPTFMSENKEKHKNIFLGFSIFHLFLNPNVYDDEMLAFGIESDSVNYSFAGNMGSGQYVQTVQLKKHFQSNSFKVDNTIFELSPFSFSRRYYDVHFRRNEVGNPGMFFTFDLTLELIKQDFPGALLIILNQLLRPVDLFDYIIKANMENVKLIWPGILVHLFTEPFKEQLLWNVKTKGMEGWNLPATQYEFDAAIDSIHKPENWMNMLRAYFRGNSIGKNFSIKPQFFEKFLQSIKAAQGFSENTIVVLLPYAPTFDKYLKQYIDEEVTISLIHTETHAKIIDLRETFEFTDDDFADAIHPKPKTMNLLVKTLAKCLLKENLLNELCLYKKK